MTYSFEGIILPLRANTYKTFENTSILDKKTTTLPPKYTKFRPISPILYTFFYISIVITTTSIIHTYISYMLNTISLNAYYIYINPTHHLLRYSYINYLYTQMPLLFYLLYLNTLSHTCIYHNTLLLLYYFSLASH